MTLGCIQTWLRACYKKLKENRIYLQVSETSLQIFRTISLPTFTFKKKIATEAVFVSRVFSENSAEKILKKLSLVSWKQFEVIKNIVSGQDQSSLSRCALFVTKFVYQPVAFSCLKIQSGNTVVFFTFGSVYEGSSSRN